jgi:spore maturation protein CgeB
VEYAGWIANHDVPRVFAHFRLTLHIPRRPYVEALPGIPTIRVFEALACGIPLICSPWEDSERLFSPGQDYLVARDGAEMRDQIDWLLHNPASAQALADRGRQTVLRRHSCRQRVDELMTIMDELDSQGNPVSLSHLPGRKAG